MVFGRALGVVATVTVTAVCVTAGSAAAAGPVIEREQVDDTFADAFLTDACGVPVTTRVLGTAITRTFDGDGTGPRTLTTLHFTVTATADGNTFRFKDVGADIVRTNRNGDEVLSIIGQIPFGFDGVLKLDVETGEPLHEPRDRSEAQLAEACAALTAA